MKVLANHILFLTFTFWTVIGHSQQLSSELTCRTKAKEIATQTYSGCVTEARNSQIDQIRKDYQKQLTELKAKYDKELKKVSGKGLTAVTTAATGSLPKAAKGVAKTLPTRKEVKNVAPPVSQIAQEDKTVTIPDPSTPASGGDESTQNDSKSEPKDSLTVPAASSDQIFTSSEGQTY
ncbi:MAG TPA: hypothetical protein VIG33_15595 [Pseudobdellovibrionaceae bacterium]|jgi:hypothetical protein